MNTLKNTTLNFGLLSTPVKVMNATTRLGDLHFSLCGPNGEELERLDHIRGTDEVVPFEDQGKTYQGHRVDLDELAAIEDACLEDAGGNDLTQISVDFFMPLKDVPFERTEDLYYIAPNRKISNDEALLHFIEGLRRRKVAAIAKVVLKKRQKLLAIFPKDRVLYAAVLRFEESIVEPTKEITVEGRANRQTTNAMAQLIDGCMGDLDDLNAVQDTFVLRKRELVERLISEGEKAAPKKPKKEKQAPEANTLLEALEASVKTTKTKTRA